MKAASYHPMFSILFAVLAMSSAAAQQSESIRLEFDSDAAEGWRQLREQTFTDQRMVIDWKLTRTGDSNQTDIDDIGQLRRFADGTDRVYYSLRRGPANAPESEKNTAHVLGGNADYLFRLFKPANGVWKEFEIDSTGTDQLEPDFQHPAGLPRQINNGDTRTFLLHNAEDDDRLAIGSEPLENFIRSRAAWIESFSERTETELGRVVTVVVNGQIDGTPRSKTRGISNTTVTGRLEFLPDRQWALLAYELVHVGLGEDGSERRRSKREMSADYEVDSNRLTRCVRSTTTRQGFVMKESRDYRRMTMQEVAEATARCRLSGYGLPEPDLD